MSVLSSGILAAVIGIVGSLFGAPLVARMNNAYAERKDRKEYRRGRVADWHRFLNDVSEKNIRDFRRTNEYSTLELLLSDSALSTVKDAFEFEDWNDEQQETFRYEISLALPIAIAVLRTEVARIERDWDLI